MADWSRRIGRRARGSADVAAPAKAVTVTGLSARVHVDHTEATDALSIDTRPGADTVDQSGLAPGAIQLSVN